ncbi:hypothetical protein SAMN05444392_104120 [Seinonella peptonophila]|uniref:CorA-like Mg2+ transporter protein n=1 Tax=Seinonella peptonophila TaxID=112248 RepID=A0A1M4X4N3_9BACL|nr:hypothetical protein [Seinonella peptonophila]SHE88415.1 hypothetical protein SAMN05444392_104120 [Seinonella peptonophila]
MNLTECLQELYYELNHLHIFYETKQMPQSRNQVFFGDEVLAYYTDQLITHAQGDIFESTSEMLYYLDESFFFEDITIKNYEFYFEDLSPDACLSFIIFYCRHRGIPIKDFPYDWIDYSIRWELGDVKTTGKPFESWGCFHSALAHSFYIIEEQMDSYGKIDTIVDPNNVLDGLKACISLAVSLLIENVPPYNLPFLEHIDEFNRALSYLKMEYQKYILRLKKATITQLELPMIDSEKTMLVNAFIITENTYIGLLKSFLIHEEEHSWLQSGFQFFAIHRPELKGTGRDIVIQVDARLKVHLRDLWEMLEDLENERWLGTRPQVKISPDRFIATQPWNDRWDTYHTITAPKMIDERTFGSKLEWSDVVGAIWELYNPAKSITVNPFFHDGSIGAPCRIYECKPILSNKKYLTAAKWNSLGQQQILVTSPTMQRYLAVCASGQYQDQVPPIYPLPSPESFDFLEIPSGFIVIHPEGVFILDDWNNKNLDLTTYRKEMQKIVKRFIAFQEIHRECIMIMNKVQNWLFEGQALSSAKIREINNWLTLNKTKIRHTILTTMFSSNDYYLQLFRDTIEKRWAIQTQLNELYDTVSELEQMVENHTNMKSNRLIVLITIFGFPVMLFSSLFQMIFEDVPSPKWLGVHWVGLFMFIGLSLISIWAINRYLNVSTKSEHKAIKKARDRS